MTNANAGERFRWKTRAVVNSYTNKAATWYISVEAVLPRSDVEGCSIHDGDDDNVTQTQVGRSVRCKSSTAYGAVGTVPCTFVLTLGVPSFTLKFPNTKTANLTSKCQCALAASNT